MLEGQIACLTWKLHVDNRRMHGKHGKFHVEEANCMMNMKKCMFVIESFMLNMKNCMLIMESFMLNMKNCMLKKQIAC
jgi:hypothetical protein